MSGYIVEYYGFPADDLSNASLNAAKYEECPFIQDICQKQLNHSGAKRTSGACTIRQVSGPDIICCPNRYYGDNFYFLQEIAQRAFGEIYPVKEGQKAVAHAKLHQTYTVGAFGKGFGGELRLSSSDSGRGEFIDWILALISPEGELEEFCAAEVQTIDTSGNYRPSKEALDRDRAIVKSPDLGLNWRNVGKRIVPQLVFKGDILELERLCKSGLFFILPEPVLDRLVSNSLGGEKNLRTVSSRSSGSITFLAYDFDKSARHSHGASRPLAVTKEMITTVSRVKEAFNSAMFNGENPYEVRIRKGLGLEMPSNR